MVLDGLSVLMSDGKTIRLAGLDIPGAGLQDADLYQLPAKAALQKSLPKGTEVLLYQTRLKNGEGRVNRMGQQVAHLVRKDNREWINGALLSQGLAYTFTSPSNPELADQMYALEDKARTGKKGLWSDSSGWKVLTPETAQTGINSYRILQGKIVTAASSKNNLYLNFGADYRKDLTVMISPALRKTLAHRGTDALALAGKTVRVRGWLRDWNGPFMELQTPEHLEVR